MSEKTYYNGAALFKARLMNMGENTVLALDFQHPNWEGEYPLSKLLFLTPESNDKNVADLETMGVRNVPKELTPSAAKKLELTDNLACCVVVHDTGKKYPNVYINEGRKLTIFDNRQ